jgi:hypothetical protein
MRVGQPRVQASAVVGWAAGSGDDVVMFMPEGDRQRMGGTMRLGARTTTIPDPDSLAYQLYKVGRPPWHSTAQGGFPGQARAGMGVMISMRSWGHLAWGVRAGGGVGPDRGRGGRAADRRATQAPIRGTADAPGGVRARRGAGG